MVVYLQDLATIKNQCLNFGGIFWLILYNGSQINRIREQP